MIALLKRLMPVRITKFQYWSHGKPIPRGWKIDEDMRRPCHHNEYSVIITRQTWGWD